MSAAVFYRLSNQVHRRQNVQCFSLIIFIIIEELARRAKIKTTCSELNALTKLTMDQVLEKLLKEFHDLKEAFDRSKAFQLPPHRPYDHKIELEGSQSQMPKSSVYQMSTPKLMETKKYLEENLKKEFISPSTGMSSFFVNKDFNPRMFFSPNNTEYTTARERLGSIKAEDINGTMQRVLKYMQQQFHKARETMTKQANKRRKEISYEIKDKVFLFSRNIITDRPFKKLEDKMLNSFPITERVGTFYQLQLPESMRVHDVFHPHLLRKNLNDSLPEQIQEPSGLIITKEGEEYELNDIENSRWYYERLQYHCR